MMLKSDRDTNALLASKTWLGSERTYTENEPIATCRMKEGTKQMYKNEMIINKYSVYIQTKTRVRGNNEKWIDRYLLSEETKTI